MEQFALAACVAAGILFGFAIAWMFMRTERANIAARATAEASRENAGLQERLNAAESRLKETGAEFEAKTVELRRHSDERAAALSASHERLLAATKASLDEQRARLDKAESEADRLREENATLRAGHAEADARMALLSDAQTKLSDTFKALSAEVLRNNNQAFLDLAKTTLEKYQDGARSDLGSRQQAIEELVKPLRESLSRVDSSIVDMEKARAAAFAGLSEQVSGLLSAQHQLRGETQTLANALRAPAVRGRWGEIQLRRVAELAGMVEHCDFEQQQAVEGEDGTLRPDLIVHLPNRRQIVVDAKVSLKAYLEALDATDETVRVKKLGEHARQVRDHLTKLGGKRYWNQFPNAPEFAVAFLPAETIFSAALEQDPGLIEFGAEQRVILATPTTLIALLKAVAYGWQQQRVTESARQISALGQTMYERLRNFSAYMEEIRRNLARTVESYNRAAGSLESRVMVSARRFRELGVGGAAEELPRVEQVEVLPRVLDIGADSAGIPAEPEVDVAIPPELATAVLGAETAVMAAGAVQGDLFSDFVKV